MTVKAYGQFVGQPGSREFVFGDVPLAIGDQVRVTGYGYGATLNDCGRQGIVVAVHRTRVEVNFGYYSNRIGGTNLARLS